LLGGAYATRRQSTTGTAIIQVADVSSAANILDIGVDDSIDVRLVAIRASEDYDTTHSSIAVSASPDAVANVIIAVGSGSNEAAIRSALSDFEQSVTQRAIEPRLQEVNAAVAAQEATLAGFNEDLEAIDQQIAELTRNDPARDFLIVSRVQLQGDARDLEASLDSLEQYENFLETGLVSTIGLTIQEPGSVIANVLVGILIMAILLIVIGYIVVILDNKVRRRLQLERIAPGVPVLGVLPNRIDTALPEVGTTRQSLEYFAREANVDGLAIIELSRPSDRDLVAELHARSDSGSELARDRSDQPLAIHAAYVLVARWGQTTEDQIASTVASLEASAPGRVGVILVGVPRRDLDWAGASYFGARPETQST
jgi:hypothetical protein